MRRLARDIISKSQLNPEFVPVKPYSKSAKVRKIYHFANLIITRGTRGGAFEDDSTPVEDDPFLPILATELYNFFTFILVQIAERLRVENTDNRAVKFILASISRYLLYIIRKRGIELSFYLDNVTGQVIIISMVAGTVSGVTGVFVTS